ncbi:MAG: YdcF family protein [Spirochaetales bacterium]|nr:YdcF family protein [Spirochaetales bacterium]
MITKFVEPWILFPGNVIALVLILFLLAVKVDRRVRKALPLGLASLRIVKWGLMALAVVLYGASIPAVSDPLMRGLEASVPPADPRMLEGAEAVVVLGGGVVRHSPAERLLTAAADADECFEIPNALVETFHSASARSALTAEAESRLLFAVRLARILGVPLVTTGGRVLASPEVPPEGEVAAALALELAFPASMVRVERESRTTAENARFTRERFGFDRVAVVTSAYHMRRSVFAFERAGLTAIPAPAAFRSDKRPVGLIDFVPNSGALGDSSTVLRETIGLVWYRLSL